MRSKYASYMKSAAWRRRRDRAVKRAGGQCEFMTNGSRCQKRHPLHVHHLSYEALGNEKAKDLMVLCDDHHAAVELLKRNCKCGKPIFDNSHDSLFHWRSIRNRHSKEDWAIALDIARSAAKFCKSCLVR